jgi:periplasmic protein CpxP/Spy
MARNSIAEKGFELITGASVKIMQARSSGRAGSKRPEDSTKMKSKLFLALILSLAVSVPVWAQSSSTDQNQPSGTTQSPEWHGRRKMPSADQQLQHMTKVLNLSEDQQAKIKPILEDRQQKMSALMQDNSLSREDRRAKFREIGSSSHEQIRAILTPDQQKKMDEMRAKREARWEKKKGEGATQSATPEQK